MKRALFAVLAVTLLASCGDDSPTGSAEAAATTTGVPTTSTHAAIVARYADGIEKAAAAYIPCFPRDVPEPQCVFGQSQALFNVADFSSRLAQDLQAAPGPVPSEISGLVNRTITAAERLNTSASKAAPCARASSCTFETLTSLPFLTTEMTDALARWAPYR